MLSVLKFGLECVRVLTYFVENVGRCIILRGTYSLQYLNVLVLHCLEEQARGIVNQTLV